VQQGIILRAYLFLLLGCFLAEKLKSQKQEQTANFSIGFWNAKKQAWVICPTQ
jgi:hypothetical protein